MTLVGKAFPSLQPLYGLIIIRPYNGWSEGKAFPSMGILRIAAYPVIIFFPIG
jgi:hypothetical protein